MARTHLDLWGKSSERSGIDALYPLVAHLIDTAAAARVICETMIPLPLRVALAEAASCDWDAWVGETSLLAGWHDIGKTTCLFQNKAPDDCPDWLRGHEDMHRVSTPGAPVHAADSKRIVWDYLSGLLEPEARLRAANVVGAHHGCTPTRPPLPPLMPACMQIDKQNAAYVVDIGQARADLLHVLIAVNGGSIIDERSGLMASTVQAGVVVLADWMVSCTPFIHEQRKRHSGTASAGVRPTEWYSSAQEIAEDRLSKTGLIRGSPSAPLPVDLLPSTSSAATALQSHLAEHHTPVDCGITFICAPTGEGKTEAGLLAAHTYNRARGSSGWYFAMPTTATADGLRDRLSGLLDKFEDNGAERGLQVLHSLAMLDDSSRYAPAAPEARDWLSGGKKALFGSYGLGTVDQILMGALQAKHTPLRVLSTAITGVVIIDEAHIFDAYMNELLEAALEWAGAMRVPVVIMSATLPAQRARSMLAAYMRAFSHDGETSEMPQCGYPGWVRWTHELGFEDSGDLVPKRKWHLHFETRRASMADMADAMARSAVSDSERGGCVLVVRNTVRGAQETFESAKRSIEGSQADCELLLLHSRFRHRDRKRHTESLVKRLGRDSSRPERMIVVTTQIAELSLDVDCDRLHTELAPVGAVLQRAGRTHRHDRGTGGRPESMSEPTAVVWIPESAAGDLSYVSPVYDDLSMLESVRLLTDGKSVSVPAELPDLVDDAETPDEAVIDEASAAARFPFLSAPGKAVDAWTHRTGTALVEEMYAKQSKVAAPHRKGSALHLMTGSTDADDLAVGGTRLGAPTRLLLPVWSDSDGGWFYELCGRRAAAVPARPDKADERSIFEACIPVADYGDRWLATLRKSNPVEDLRRGTRSAWRSGPLRGVLLLDMGTPFADHTIVEERRIGISEHLGLTVERPS